MFELTLYYRPTCPYCGKVLGFMRDNDISVDMKDISGNPQFESELINIGGMRQVPCLVIDGKAMYESDDIIEWMRANLLS